MKNRFTSVLILNLLLLVSLALPGRAAEPDIKKLIEGLQTRYGQMKGMAANFTQVYRDRAGRQLREEGTLMLKRPGRMRWEYLQPEKKLFVTDGKNVYFYVPADRQVTVTPIKEADDPRTPFVFLLGRTDLKKDFSSIDYSKSESPLVAGNVVLEMVPKRASNTLKRLFVEVDPQQMQLSRLVLINGADARSDFLLSNFRENFIAGDDQFSFTPPAGVTVLH